VIVTQTGDCHPFYIVASTDNCRVKKYCRANRHYLLKTA